MAGGQVGGRAGRHRHVGLGYGDQEIAGNDEHSDSRHSAEYCGCVVWKSEASWALTPFLSRAL